MLTVSALLLSGFATSAQYSGPQTPQPSGFTPVMPEHRQYSSPPSSYPTYQTPAAPVIIGGTAESVYNQINGNRSSGYGMSNDPAYNQERGNFTPRQIQQQKELLALLGEVRTVRPGSRGCNSCGAGDYTSPAFLSETKDHRDALQTLKDMLSGKRKLSITDAYYTVENAFGDAYLRKPEFDAILKESISFIKTWIAQNDLDKSNNEVLNMAVQRFMSDTLTITDATGKLVTHYPYSYDFQDYTGEKDHRNFFASKCLATGTGQCSSLPVVYLMLTEGIGATAYLTLAPQHSFVKYPDASGAIHNYEPTSNWKITDQWYIENMAIGPKALQVGSYLDTLNSRQIVANCMIDLAFSYMLRYGAADGRFVRRCTESAAKEFPKQNNLQVLFVYSSYLARQLDKIISQEQIATVADIDRYPVAVKVYAALQENEAALKERGYQPMPESLYQDIIQQHEFKGQKQRAIGVATKQPRSLFATANSSN